MKFLLTLSKARTSVAVMAVTAGIFVAAAAFAQAPDLEKMDFVLRSVPDGPVARVNGIAIRKSEFISLYQSEIGATMKRLRTSKIPDSARLEIGIKSVVKLIQREILLQEATKRKLTIANAELEKRWTEELDVLKDSVRRRKDKSAAADVSSEKIGEAEFLEAMGITRENALAEYGKILLVEKVRERIAKEKGVAVSKQEVAVFFDENKEAFKKPERLHLQQIFVKAPRREDVGDDKKRADARGRIEKGLQRIRAGESFATVAKSVSESRDKDKGGDLGPMPVSALPPFFVEPATTMRPGDISDIIESDLGYHVIKVIDVLSGADPRLDDVASRIRVMLEGMKAETAVNDFCRPFLKEPGFVQIYLQLDKTLATHPDLENMKAKTKADSK